MESAKISRIVTAHRFMKLGKLEALAKRCRPSAEFVYLEDVRENLSLLDKAAAAVGLVAARAGCAPSPSPIRPR